MKIRSAEEHTIHFVTTDNPHDATHIRISSVSWLQGTTAGYTTVHSPRQLEEEFQKHLVSTCQPHVLEVRKDIIYAAITALDLGLGYARDCLATNLMATPGHKRWAETMEAHIKQMEDALKALRTEGSERNSATTTQDQDHAANNQSHDDLKKMHNNSGELLGAWNQHSADSIRKMYDGVSEALAKELDSMIQKAITLHLGTENWNLEEVTKRATLLLYEGTKITAVTIDGKPILFYGEPTFDGKGFTRKYHIVSKPEEPNPALSDIITKSWILENAKKNRQMHHMHASIEERSEPPQ